MSRRLVLTAVATVTWSLGPALAPTAFAAPSPAVIHVDDNAAADGNGSGKSPFNNLTAGVAAARARSAAVVIKVEPGDYPLAAPLVIDFPVELRGSTEQVLDADGWPTGAVASGTETRILATSAIGAQALIRVGRTDATVLHGVTVRGFVFQGTPTSIGVLLTRVQGYLVADNAFGAPMQYALQSGASSGEVTSNHMGGIATGAIFNGGYPESPSNVVVTGNRMVNNNLGGIVLLGSSFNIPELGDELHAVVRNNDLSNNTGQQGFGLRLFVIRRDAGMPGDSQSSAHVHAVVQGNRLVGNRLGVVIDAGFPYRSVAGVCDPRVFSGTIEAEFAGNVLTSSTLTPALITFTRSNAALVPTMLPLWQYLHDATFTISDVDGTLANAWIDHPAADPYIGPCPGDATHESLGNILIYNGVAVPTGRNF